MAPSVQAFSDTERIVVPKSAGMTVVSIYHQQFNCLKITALKDLLRRNFLILNLDDLVHKCVKACYNCAATRDEKHIQAPMSSVTPPETFGLQFATDVIEREKQKILTLRETATSYTWAKLIKNETADELESGLRYLFAQAGPPNATRARTCRTDNAKSFVSLSNNKALMDIGVTIDLCNAQNKNGNPVAERNNSEVQNAILNISPAGGQISECELAEAISALNAKPRWTGMSSSELWTGRDMLSGSTLNFTQTDIIKRQHSKRAARHLRPDLPSKTFAIGDIVFSNSDRSKLKARDKLIVREDIGNGQYRLDRLCGKSTYITTTVKPDFDLYTVEKAEETRPTEPEKSVSWNDSNTVINNDDETPTPDRDIPTNIINPPRSGPVTRSSLPQRQRQESPPKRRLLPPAPGKAAGYNPQPEHQAQTDFQPAVTYLITPSYVPDNVVIAPPTAEDPPPTEPDGPADPTSSDTDSDDTEGEGFLTPTGSPQPTDDSEHSDPSHTDQDEIPVQESSNEDTPQAGPSTRTPQRPKVKTRPGKRPRSSPLVPKTAKRPRSALKRIADHNSGPLAADPGHRAQPPLDAEQDARPRLTSRSGRPLKPPDKLIL